jgi:hypothetical protein
MKHEPSHRPGLPDMKYMKAGRWNVWRAWLSGSARSRRDYGHRQQDMWHDVQRSSQREEALRRVVLVALVAIVVLVSYVVHEVHR